MEYNSHELRKFPSICAMISVIAANSLELTGLFQNDSLVPLNFT